jgi:hypothetical protein
MKLIFACTINKPWPWFLQRERVPNWLMSYFQLQDLPDLEAFLKSTEPKDES